MALENLLQFVIAGISIGSIYALAGLGFMVIYRVTRVVNFAQGEFIMLGGVGSAWLWSIGIPLPLASIVSVAAVTCIGLVMYMLVIYPIRRAPAFSLILVTFGASIVIRGVATLYWGTDPRHLPNFSSSKPLNMGRAILNTQVIWVVFVTAAIALALWFFFSRTLIGKAFRASAVDPLVSQLVGIRPETMGLLAFGIAAFLGALGGVVIGPITYPTVDIGLNLSVKGFVAALIGGLDRNVGVIVGGLALGLFESLAAGFISSGYKEPVSLGAFLIILTFRRHGLMGGKQAGRI